MLDQLSNTYQQEIFIFGGKPVNFKSDDGRTYDYVKINMLSKLKGQGAFGYTTVPVKWGSSQDISEIQDLPTPFSVMATMENVSDGKTNEMVILDVDLKSVKYFDLVPKQKSQLKAS